MKTVEHFLGKLEKKLFIKPSWNYLLFKKIYFILLALFFDNGFLFARLAKISGSVNANAMKALFKDAGTSYLDK